MTDASRSRLPALLLAPLLALLVAAAVADHAVFHRPPDMIQASYMIGALDLLGDRAGGPLVDLTPYGDQLGPRYYPPLYPRALAVAFRALGPSHAAVLAVSLPLAVLAVLAVFVAGGARGDPWEGLLAAALLVAFPGFRAAAAGVHLDFGMACLAAVACALLVRYLERGGAASLIGLGAVSAAAWLTRWTFAVPAAALLLGGLGTALAARRRSPDGPSRRRAAVRFAAVAGASLLAAAPFAVWLLARADMDGLVANATAEPARLSTLGTLTYYAEILAGDDGAGPPLAALAVVALLLPWTWRSGARWPWLAGLLLGLIAFTALPPKQPRYVLFALPPLAVVAAAGVRGLRPPWLRLGATLAAVAVAGVVLVADVSARRPADPDVLPGLLATLAAHAPAERQARVLVHDRYYPPEAELNAPVLIFTDAARVARGGAGPWRFVEGLFEHELVYGPGCEAVSGPYDLLVVPAVRTQLDAAQRDPFFDCLDLELIDTVRLYPYCGRDALAWVYRVR